MAGWGSASAAVMTQMAPRRSGRSVRPAGARAFSWDGLDEKEQVPPAGICFLEFRSGCHRPPGGRAGMVTALPVKPRWPLAS